MSMSWTTYFLWSSQYDVAVLRWPQQAHEVQQLEQLGLPRLLLVEPGDDPPTEPTCLQDWVRLPAVDADVHVRLRILAGRAAAHGKSDPTIDEFGVLTLRGQTLFLSPTEHSITRLLIAHFGSMVTDADLLDAAWPDGRPERQVLRVHISRLRKRLAPIGLTITSVRNAGYLIHSEVDHQMNDRAEYTAVRRSPRGAS
jgi:DNA-binding winged helix-turn-helix (wHTH) protein